MKAGEQPGARAPWWRPVLLIAAVLAIIIVAHLLGVKERLGSLREWIASLGAWGPLAFVLIYIAAVVTALPGAVLTLAAGAMFGVVYGVMLVSIASTAGASLAFLISRYIAREAVARWLGHSEKFRELDRLSRERGAVIVALTRLVPLFPFNLLNYGFGLTAVPFRTYVFWSWLCMLPGTVLYVAGADAIASALRTGRLPWGVLAALALAVVALAILVPRARRRLSAPSEPAPGAGSKNVSAEESE